MTLHSILAVTDFSRQGGHAIARAALLGAEHRAAVRIVYQAPAGEMPPPDAALRLSHHALQIRQRHNIEVQADTRVHLAAVRDQFRPNSDARLPSTCA